MKQTLTDLLTKYCFITSGDASENDNKSEHNMEGMYMVFNVIFNNISILSLRSVLLMEETGVPGENYRPVTSHWQTLSYNVVSSTPRYQRNSNSHDRHSKSSCHTITATTAPEHMLYNLRRIPLLFYDKKICLI